MVRRVFVMPRTVLFCCALIVVALCGRLSAQDHTISFQGVLTDMAGIPLPDGSYQMTFSVYECPGPDTARWSELQVVQVADGVFNVSLGTVQPLFDSIPVLRHDRKYCLGVMVGGEEILPRQPLASVMNALHAADIGGVRAGGALDGSYPAPSLADGGVTAPKLKTENSPSTGMALVYGGGGMKWDFPSAGSGDITSVTAGGGLTGGGGSGDVTLAVATHGITTDMLQDGAVLASKVSPTGAMPGQSLGFDGTKVTWLSSAGFSLPYSGSGSATTSSLFRLTNTGTGAIATFDNTSGSSIDIGNVNTGIDVHVGGIKRGLTVTAADGAGLEVYSSTGTGIVASSVDRAGLSVSSQNEDALVAVTYAALHPAIRASAGHATASAILGMSSNLETSATIGTPQYGVHASAQNNKTAVYGVSNNANTEAYGKVAGVVGEGELQGIVGGAPASTFTYPVTIGVRGIGDHGVAGFVPGLTMYSHVDRAGVIGHGGSYPGTIGESFGSHGVHGLSRDVMHAGVYGGNTESSGLGVYGKCEAGGAYGYLGAKSGGYATNGTAEVTLASGIGAVLARFGSPGNAALLADATYAGDFTGNVRITGNLSVSGTITAGVKAFAIDHPLDPENRLLVHAAMESDEMLNVYSGNVRCDVNGEATVRLPAYAAATTIDLRYHLTCVGGWAQVYVAEELKDGVFRIAGGTPGLKVSWQVTGRRDDAWARAHPLVPEQEKSVSDRGRYLQPEAYGADATRGIGAEAAARLHRAVDEHRIDISVSSSSPVVVPEGGSR